MRVGRKTASHSPPQVQVLTLAWSQYAALANWVKGVKLEISALERAVTALGTRSLSTSTSPEGPGSGTGEAQTDGETRLARSKNFETFGKDRGNISWELNANSRLENEEPKPWGELGEPDAF